MMVGTRNALVRKYRHLLLAMAVVAMFAINYAMALLGNPNAVWFYQMLGVM